MKRSSLTRREALQLGTMSAVSAFMPRVLAQNSSGFRVEGDHFTLHGQPIQVLSGEMHYARIPRAYWRHRIQMAKAMGLNTIATYVFWNIHETYPGQFDFTDNNDLAAFLKLAQEEHMHVLLRAGPYSCAEWEFGGFPAWLLKDPKMSTALRTTDPAFMEPVKRWMMRLGKEVARLQIENGGPIIATQIENEYGNFSNDHAYMKQMRDVFIAAGFTKSLLYTVDPSKALANGQIDGVYSGVNFGTGNATHGLDLLAASRPGQPLFSTEYWPGWFDLWGHPHETRPIEPQLKDLEEILSRKASLNIYMVHGGTSFGMMAGASQSTGNYRGNVTSYDYDAPINEAGHPTPKFTAYRDVILKHTSAKPLIAPDPPPVIAIDEFTLDRSIPYDMYLPQPLHSGMPLTMEEVDQAYGYILYRKTGLEIPPTSQLKLDHMQDYAVVLIEGERMGTLDRHYKQDTLTMRCDIRGPVTLDILVENTGRLNSTKWMREERKGMRGATLDGKPLTGWDIYPLSMERTLPFHLTDAPTRDRPEFLYGDFRLDVPGDTYLDVRELKKGVLWINGRCLGRFWNIGPQNTLYLPGPWLKKGRNDVVALELFPSNEPIKLSGLTRPILAGPTPTYKDDPEHQKKPDADAEFGPKLAAPATTPAPK